jgi:hypothetical protein
MLNFATHTIYLLDGRVVNEKEYEEATSFMNISVEKG